MMNQENQVQPIKTKKMSSNHFLQFQNFKRTGLCGGFSRIVFVGFALLSSGCLMTRDDVDDVQQKRQLQDQVGVLQKTNADQLGRIGEFSEQLRSLNGRIELLESEREQLKRDKEIQRQSAESVQAESNKKLVLIQEELHNLQQQLNDQKAALAAALSDHRENSSKNSDKKRGTSGEKQVNFDQAESLFAAKEWRKAILQYQKHKELNPKSKLNAEATYKIGVCFAELGLKEDAKTFFQDTGADYPDSPFAKKSKAALKKLK